MLQLIGLVVVVAAVGWLVVTLWPVLLFLTLCGLVLAVAAGGLALLLSLGQRRDGETVEEWMQRRHPHTLARNAKAVAEWRERNGGRS